MTDSSSTIGGMGPSPSGDGVAPATVPHTQAHSILRRTLENSLDFDRLTPDGAAAPLPAGTLAARADGGGRAGIHDRYALRDHLRADAHGGVPTDELLPPRAPDLSRPDDRGGAGKHVAGVDAQGPLEFESRRLVALSLLLVVLGGLLAAERWMGRWRRDAPETDARRSCGRPSSPRHHPHKLLHDVRVEVRAGERGDVRQGAVSGLGGTVAPVVGQGVADVHAGWPGPAGGNRPARASRRPGQRDGASPPIPRRSTGPAREGWRRGCASCRCHAAAPRGGCGQFVPEHPHCPRQLNRHRRDPQGAAHGLAVSEVQNTRPALDRRVVGRGDPVAVQQSRAEGAVAVKPARSPAHQAASIMAERWIRSGGSPR
jgi:hypothetical protein